MQGTAVQIDTEIHLRQDRFSEVSSYLLGQSPVNISGKISIEVPFIFRNDRIVTCLETRGVYTMDKKEGLHVSSWDPVFRQP